MKYKRFVELCKMTQEELKEYVTQKLVDYGYDPVVNDGYVYAKGNGVDVLLTAHLDTVHKEVVKDVYVNNGIIKSPQGIGGDDRCGVFIILRILSETRLRPSILFCEDEEIGGVGSGEFVRSDYITDLEKLKFLVEIDRHGNNDAVFYSCDNPDFTRYITETTQFKENWGTFSDISNLSPICGVASVNLSCGYYKEHTSDEYVVYREMMNTKNVIVGLLKASARADHYEYIEEKVDWDTYYDRYGYSGLEGYIWVQWKENCDLQECFYSAQSKYEGFGFFFSDHPNVTFNDIYDYDFYYV